MKRWCAILLAALALVFWTGCNDDNGSGSNGEPDGMTGEPDGFTGQPDADPNPTPEPTMEPDGQPDGQPDAQPTPDPEPTMEPDAGCLPEFYQGLEGVFEGMLTTTSRGPNIPEQTSTSPFTLFFDDNGGQPEQIPGCIFTPDEDQCFFETGSVSITECDNDGFGSRTVSTTLASTDSEDQYTQNTRIQSTTTQDGMILSESTTDQTFSLTRVDEDTLRYEADTSTTTPNGVFTSESTGTLRRAQ